MSQSLSRVIIHLTFSTKNRLKIIDAAIKDDLFCYFGGICKELGCNPIIIGGHFDHIHILCILSKKISQMKFIEEIKKSSSKWIKTKSLKYQDFYWQGGYAIFSVNHRDVAAVREYIKSQELRHRKINFQEEFLQLLRENDIVFDERYLWD